MTIMAEAPLTPGAADRADRLFRLHHGRVFKLAYTRTRHHATAEDVAGETWLRVTRSIHLLRASDDQEAFGWIASILRCAVRDHYRPRRSEERPTDWGGPAGASLPSMPAAEDVALARITVTERQAA